MSEISGIGKKSRKMLSDVLSKGRGVIDVTQAAEALEITRKRASELLARWAKNGWLFRVKRGCYVPVPLESETCEIVVEDPWVIGSQIFSPCYIGGWSAAQHWDFTEQLFETVVVITTKRVNLESQKIQGAKFLVTKVSQDKMFGTKAVWHDGVKIQVSDPTKTIVDIFNGLRIGGGIMHAIDIYKAYLSSEYRDLNLLLEYGERMQNRTLFKRLGFLSEMLGVDDSAFIKSCYQRISHNYSQLDPSVKGKAIKTKWRLWIPESFREIKYD